MIAFPNHASGGAKAPEFLLVTMADHQRVACHFRGGLPVSSATEPHLRRVIEDTLDHPGSLARAQLAFSIVRDLTGDTGTALDLGSAVEYFHTASLLFDDLPSMDNATERRGRPCPHVTSGEAAAILGALAFVNQGYRLLWQAIDSLSPDRRVRAVTIAGDCLGVAGILNGQAMDLNFGASPRRSEDALDAARGKTVTLIRLTLVLPALVGGASDDVLRLLDQLSEHWGLAYQILDDCKDCLLTRSETGKSTGQDAALGRPNYAVVAGLDAAFARLAELLCAARAALEPLPALGLDSGALRALHERMEKESRRLLSHLTAA
jgi:geranylgeranyl pyrophosphate synthase